MVAAQGNSLLLRNVDLKKKMKHLVQSNSQENIDFLFVKLVQ